MRLVLDLEPSYRNNLVLDLPRKLQELLLDVLLML